MRFLAFMKDQAQAQIMPLGFLALLLVAALDYLTGPEMSFSIFYLLPVGAAAWFAGRQAGILMATAGGICWLLAERLWVVPYSHFLIPYWNALIRLGIFLVVAYLLSALKLWNERLEERVREKTISLTKEIEERKRSEEERERLIHQLEDALANVKQLKGLLPICASCKRIRDDRGYWNQIEEYIRMHTEAEFSHGLCPECARKLYPELYKTPG